MAKEQPSPGHVEGENRFAIEALEKSHVLLDVAAIEPEEYVLACSREYELDSWNWGEPNGLRVACRELLESFWE